MLPNKSNPILVYLDSLNLNYFIQSQLESTLSSKKSYAAAQKMLSHKDQVQSFRMLASKEMRDYCTNKKTSDNADQQLHAAYDSERVERLLLRVSSLKKLNTSIMEELFFNDVIGNVQIDSLIPSIIGSEIGESVKENI